MTWVDWILALAVIASTIFVYCAVDRNAELRGRITTLAGQLRACSWLANYHARYTWALQDLLAQTDDISYPEVYKRASNWLLAAGNSRLSLFIPMDRVPRELQDDAMLYNSAVWSRLPSVYSEPISAAETPEQQRMRLLESGLQMQTCNLRRYGRRIAIAHGHADVIDDVLETLEAFIKADMERLFGVAELKSEELVEP
jgi:hypothetical protein